MSTQERRKVNNFLLSEIFTYRVFCRLIFYWKKFYGTFRSYQIMEKNSSQAVMAWNKSWTRIEWNRWFIIEHRQVFFKHVFPPIIGLLLWLWKESGLRFFSARWQDKNKTFQRRYLRSHFKNTEITTLRFPFIEFSLSISFFSIFSAFESKKRKTKHNSFVIKSKFYEHKGNNFSGEETLLLLLFGLIRPLKKL